MGQVAHTNNTKNIQHVGGKMIRPGETREVDETLLPDYNTTPATPSANGEVEMVQKILGHKVADLPSLIASLSEDDLTLIEGVENQREKPRRGALKVFAEERLRRASAAQDVDQAGDEDMQRFVDLLAEMDDAELSEQIDLYADDELSLAAVNAEIDRRAVTVSSDDVPPESE